MSRSWIVQPSSIGIPPKVPTPSISPAAYLEQLQKRVYDALGQAFEPHDPDFDEAARRQILEHQLEAKRRFFSDQVGKTLTDADLSALLEDAERQLRAADDVQPPTRFQNRDEFALISQYAIEIEQASEAVGMSVPARPTLGSLPLGRLDALAVRVPNSSAVVVAFHEGTFSFLHLLSKVLVLALPIDVTPAGTHFSVDSDAVAARLRDEESVVARFHELLDAYLFAGHAYRATPYLLDEPYRTMADFFLASSELFLLCHEYGHMMSGHFDRQATHQRRLAHGSEVDALAQSWEREFEADFVGLQILLAVMNRVHEADTALAYVGVPIVFTAMQVVDQALGLLFMSNKYVAPLGSHPPATERRQALDEGLRYFLSHTEWGEDATNAALQLAEAVDGIIWRLWHEHTFMRYMSMQLEGARPAEIWVMD